MADEPARGGSPPLAGRCRYPVTRHPTGKRHEDHGNGTATSKSLERTRAEELNMKHADDAGNRDRETTRRLDDLRRELLAEYERCDAERRATSDGDDVEEGAYDSTNEILEHLSQELREVEAALERVRAGTYGLCADCGEAIRATRLRAVPTARRCLQCQVGLERRKAG